MAGANPFDSGGSGQSSGFSLPSGGAKLKRDKRSIAAYLKEEFTRTNNKKGLNDYIDGVCDSQKPIDDPDTIDWYKWIIAGGMTYDEFGKKGNTDNHTFCFYKSTKRFHIYKMFITAAIKKLLTIFHIIILLITFLFYFNFFSYYY